MKLITALVAFVAVFALACGGGSSNNSGATGTSNANPAANTATPIATPTAAAASTVSAPTNTGAASSGSASTGSAATDADRVAHAGLPTLQDLPGTGWSIAAQDNFGSSSSSDFATLIEGTPECATLQNLAALASVFGGDNSGSDQPLGRGQIEFDKQDPGALLPTSVEAEIKVEQSAASSTGQFTIVKNLFESEDTSNCLIAVLNNQFAQNGPSGLQIQVTKGTSSAEAPENGARMAFNIDMSIAEVQLHLGMQLYFWPYRNASVQVLFLGAQDSLDAQLVGSVLNATDRNLKAAMGQ